MRRRLGIAMVFASLQAGCGRVRFDAGADAGSDGAGDEDAAPGFCASLPAPVTFCDDFDSGPITEHWSRIIRDAPGLIAIEESSDAPSGTSTLHVEMNATAGNCLYNQVRAQRQGAFSRAHAEVDVFVPSGGAAGQILSALNFSDGASTCQTLVTDGSYAEQTIDSVDNRQYDRSDYAAMSEDSWHHIEYDYVITPGQGHLRIEVDGVVHVDKDAMYTCLFSTGLVQYDVGLFCVDSPTETQVVRYDNVVLDVQ